MRAELIRGLGFLGGPSDGRFLARFAEDPEPVVRLETLKALARMRVAGAVPLLVRAAVSDPEPVIQKGSQAILGTTRPEVLADHLSRMLCSAHEWVRRASVRYASTVMGPAGEPLLREALENPDEVVRAYAAQWLEQLAPLAARTEPEASFAVETPAAPALPPAEAAPEPPQPRVDFAIGWENFLGDPAASLSSKPRMPAENPEMDVSTGAMAAVPRDARELAAMVLPAAAAAPPPPSVPNLSPAADELERPAEKPPPEPSPPAPPPAAARPSRRRMAAAARPAKRCTACGEELPAVATRCHACGEAQAGAPPVSRPRLASASRPAAVGPLAALHVAIGVMLLYVSLPVVVDDLPRGLAVVAMAVTRFAAGIDLWRGKSWAHPALVALQASELRTVGAIATPASLVLLGLLFLPGVRHWASR